MRKAILVFCLIVSGSLLLSGCSKNNNETQSENSESKPKIVDSIISEKNEQTSSSNETNSNSTISSETSSSTTESQVTNVLWNKEKKAALKSHMMSWGQIMKQTYQEYDETKDTNYAGLTFPSGFSDYENRMAVGDTPVTISWSPDGTGSSDYNVVGIYCNVYGGTVGGYLYLFTFHNHQPVILVTSQNQAMPDNRLHFKETENEDLKKGFVDIANNQYEPESSEETAFNPIDYSEAKRILAREGIIFDDKPGHLVKDGEFDFTSGGNNIPLENGGILLRQYSGARGFEQYTLTPNTDGTIHIVWETSSIDGGKRVNIENMKDIVVNR